MKGWKRRERIKENKNNNCFSTFDTNNKTEISISCHTTLKNYLKGNPNPYNTFIFGFLNGKPKKMYKRNKIFLTGTSKEPNNQETENNSALFTNSTQKHHIFPIFSGGPDCNWNIINLSVKDHFKAHSLRYDVYQEEGDRVALSFWTNPSNNTDEAIQRRIKLSHANSKKNCTGFNNSENQRKNGNKGGKVISESKIEKFKEKRGEKVSQIIQNDSV